MQAAWNFERMQNLGFAYCITPWLRRVFKGNDPARRAALRRHLEFFNTQPHMAGFIVGVVARMEEEAAAENRDPEARVRSFKMAMSSALAAIGDKFLWGTLKPLCAIFCVALWVAHKATDLSLETCVAAAIAAYLIAFNAPALWLRWKGIRFGYDWGETIAVEMKRFNWQRRIRGLRQAGLAAATAVILAAIVSPPHGAKTILIRAAGLAGCLAVKKLRLTVLRIYWLIVAIGIAVTLGGWSV